MPVIKTDPLEQTPDFRATNAGAWAEWIEKIPKRDREDVFTLAERILPGLVYQAHSRNSGHRGDEQDDVAISTALRIAQRFYARIGRFNRKRCPCGDPDCENMVPDE